MPAGNGEPLPPAGLGTGWVLSAHRGGPEGSITGGCLLTVSSLWKGELRGAPSSGVPPPEHSTETLLPDGCGCAPAPEACKPDTLGSLGSLGSPQLPSASVVCSRRQRLLQKEGGKPLLLDC